jgi:biopolymer transport protein ExbD
MAEGRRSSRKAARREGVSAFGALRITPMIDVVFLLLLYFMLNARFAPDELLFRVDVPRPQRVGAPDDPFALPERPITVTVRSTGDGAADCVITTDSPLLPDIRSYEQFTIALTAARGRSMSPGQRFQIRTEPGALWEHALGTLDAIVKSDFTNVRFTEPAT